MPRGKAGSALTKAQPPCHWLDLPRLPLLRILEVVHATSSVRFGRGSDAAPLPHLLSHSSPAAVLLPSTPTTLPLHPSAPGRSADAHQPTRPHPGAPHTRGDGCSCKVQPACAGRGIQPRTRFDWVTPPRLAPCGTAPGNALCCLSSGLAPSCRDSCSLYRRLAISQGSGQQAQTLQTCAGVFVAEGASSGMPFDLRLLADSMLQQLRPASLSVMFVACWPAGLSCGAVLRRLRGVQSPAVAP